MWHSKKAKTIDDSCSEETSVKSSYSEYFDIVMVKNVKYGFCKNCGKNAKGELKVKFKMTGHNTTSLRNHLKNAHSKLFSKFLARKDVEGIRKTAEARNAKLNEFFKVKSIPTHDQRNI